MYEQPFNPYAANLAAVKNCLSRPKVLIMGILTIISAIVGVINTVLISTNIKLILQSVFSFFESNGVSLDGADEALNSATATVPISMIVNISITAIITLLYAAGFIIMYVKSRNTSPESSPKSGVNILYVFAVISLVLTVLGVLGAVILILLCSFLFITSTSGNGSSTSVMESVESSYNLPSGAMTAILIVLGVIILIAIIYALFIAINRVRFYGSIRNSMSSVELENKGASPYGVICIISAVFTALSIFNIFSLYTALTTVRVYTPIITIFAMSILSTVLSVVMLITEATIALSYKKHIDNIKYGYADAVDQGYPAGVHYGGSHFADRAPRRDVRTSDQSRQGVNPYDDGFSDAAPSQRQSAPPVCPFCGAPDDGSTFCSNCGAKLK